jgi:hypothetical protein
LTFSFPLSDLLYQIFGCLSTLFILYHSRGVYDKGYDKGVLFGIDEGMALGMDKSTLNSINKMMITFHITIDQAMDILEVPDKKREYYKSQISE